MYELALTVSACLRAGTRVHVAWPVDGDPTEAVALTPGGGRVGTLWDGALDGQLAERAGARGRLLTLEVSDLEAAAVGRSAGGRVRILLMPADGLPGELWPALAAREPVALEVTLGGPDGSEVVGAALLTTEPSDHSESVVTDGSVVSLLSPTPTLLVAGPGPVAAALAEVAPTLGWRVQWLRDAASAAGLAPALAPIDLLVSTVHDDEEAGTVLAAALSGRAGYVAALGSRARNDARRTWLADRGVDGIDRIHGPAGLDIGAGTPAEVAIAILAEAIASRPRPA